MQPLLQPTALSMLLSLSESQLDSSVEQGADIVQQCLQMTCQGSVKSNNATLTATYSFVKGHLY